MGCTREADPSLVADRGGEMRAVGQVPRNFFPERFDRAATAVFLDRVRPDLPGKRLGARRQGHRLYRKFLNKCFGRTFAGKPSRPNLRGRGSLMRTAG